MNLEHLEVRFPLDLELQLDLEHLVVRDLHHLLVLVDLWDLGNLVG